LDDIILHIDPEKNKQRKSFGTFVKDFLFVNKFAGWLGFSMFLIISSILAFAVIKSGVSFAVIGIAGLVGLPIVYFLVVKPEFGIMAYLTLAYTIMWFYVME